MLSLQGVSKRYGGLPALADVSFEVEAGTVTALIGPNGAGKSTALNCISGLLRPDAGSITFGGREVTGLAAHRIARLGMARTFQNLKIFPRLSVLDNVLCGLSVRAGRSLLLAMLRPPRLRHRERALRLRALAALDVLGLTERAHIPAGVLPYGEWKRLEMARAFVSDPLIALLDEPVAGLNADETAQVAALIRSLRAAGRTMLLIEHDMDLVMGVSDWVVVLDGGRVIARGTPEEVRKNPLVLEAYRGQAACAAAVKGEGALGTDPVVG
ncbi:MAG: ABC transporter ATP-binding protein, partial [Deltaproteobacteria bacterium]|nr:ABC transporter ATP-binding protein [Deltaproteobacteria bacterium]